MKPRLLMIAALAFVCCTHRAPGTPPTSDDAFLTPSEMVSDPLRAAARAIGMADLRTTPLPENVREVRLSDAFPWVVGQQRMPMLRITVHRPDSITGELALFWIQQRDQPIEHRGTSCISSTSGWSVCARSLPATGVSWDTVAARLDSLGVWTISEPCEDLLSAYDAGDLHLQRRVGQQFDTYKCNAPTMRDRTEAGCRAKALYEYLHAVARGIHRSRRL